MSATRSQSAYVLGHTAEELERLDRQGEILRPLTRRMLVEAGIGPGMRVLDVGCGTGDLSLLVHELVGDGGHVTAIDRVPEAVATTRDRFLAKGIRNASVVQSDIDGFAPTEPFDAVVGRLVLMYLPDPAATLRRLAGFARPGGIIAFIEIVLPEAPLHGAGIVPELDRAQSWVTNAFRRAGCAPDMGLRQVRAFEDAGLGRPELRIEGLPVIHDETHKIRWLAGTVRSLLPAIVESGVATEAEVEIETLAERLIAASAGRGAIVLPLAYGGAWVRTAPA